MDYSFNVYKIIEEDGTEQWICEFPDLLGCIGVGDTYFEAVEEGMLNKDVWIESALEVGRDIPVPKSYNTNDYSGKFNLRLPKSLHKNLSIRADKEGVSLNTFCQCLLAEGLGERCASPVFNFNITMPKESNEEVEDNWGKKQIKKQSKVIPLTSAS